MAASLADHPGGKVSEVVKTNAERQGAYDALASESVTVAALIDSAAQATVARCAGHSVVHVVVDGTSLRLTDRADTKGFGGVGPTMLGARGLKVVHAYGVSLNGVPLGILDQQWWARTPGPTRRDGKQRPLEAKETQHWTNCIDSVAETMDATATRAWFQLDREGDAYWILKTLGQTKHLFTVRSSWPSRVVMLAGRSRPTRLGVVLDKRPVRYAYQLDIDAGPGRRARRARMHVRTATVTLDMVEKRTERRSPLTVNVVEVREVHTTPHGEKPVHWRLLTNHPIDTDEDVAAIVEGYTRRWAIEELHRTWKTGACNVEDAQLRSMDRMVKWAVMSVTVAARIERLKVLARTEPTRPAASEFSAYELEALVRLKRGNLKRNERMPRRAPTVGEAVLWIAELGGYTGKSSGGPPGSVTIRRGLDYLAPAAAIIESLRTMNEM
jgi:hypothetical protein